MTQTVRIRPAQPQDAGAVRDIINHVVRDTLITFTVIEKTEADIVEAMAQADGAYFVAEDQTGVIGYASYGPFRPGPGYAHTKEHSIALTPDTGTPDTGTPDTGPDDTEQRSIGRRGVGRALMQALERHAAHNGVHVLIGGVSGENAPGLAFHLACGFTEAGRLPEVGHKFGRKLDLVLMHKRVGDVTLTR